MPSAKSGSRVLSAKCHLQNCHLQNPRSVAICKIAVEPYIHLQNRPAACAVGLFIIFGDSSNKYPDEIRVKL
jgi:hypothetical protein